MEKCIAKYQLSSQAIKKIIMLLLIQDLDCLGSLSGTDTIQDIMLVLREFTEYIFKVRIQWKGQCH